MPPKLTVLFASLPLAIEPANMSLVIPEAFTLRVSPLTSSELSSTLTFITPELKPRPGPATLAVSATCCEASFTESIPKPADRSPPAANAAFSAIIIESLAPLNSLLRARPAARSAAPGVPPAPATPLTGNVAKASFAFV